MEVADEFQFQIPDRELSYSQDPVPDDLVRGKLEDCKRELVLYGTSALHSFFPVINSVIRHFSKHGKSTRELLWKIVFSELKVLTGELSECDFLQLEPNKKKVLRNSTKMLCFIGASLAEEFENDKKNKEKEKNTLVWEEERLKLMTLFVRLNCLELVNLWDPPSIPIMEDLATLLASVCYKFLENPSIVHNKKLLDTISKLLGTILTKYGLVLSASLKLVQLLQHFEHLIGPISNLVVAIATQYSCKQLVTDIFREICSMSPSDLAKDSSGTKSFANFVVMVSGEVPALVLPALPVLIPHLSGESTAFRNGVLGVFGELLKLLSDSSVDGHLLPDVRNQMLSRLMDHLHDVNAFVRVKVLHILLELSSVQGIPLHLLQEVLDRAIERLKDKSSLVRKGALQLLSAMLSSNPFAAKLDVDEFRRRLDKENNDINSENSGEQTAVAQYLQAALDFATSMSRCIPMAIEMMRSKTTSDVLESVEFLCVCNRFGLERAEDAISKSLPLVWSQDKRLCDAVVSAYAQLYLSTSGQKDHAEQIVLNLLHILSAASLGELASLEKLVGLFVSSGHVPASAVNKLWQLYHKKKSERGAEDSVLSCQLLSMILSTTAATDASIPTYVDQFMSCGSVQSNDLLMVKHMYAAINKLLTRPERAIRLPNNHAIFSHMSFILKSTFKNFETSQWIPLCEQAVTLVYRLSEQPNCISESLLKDLSQLCDFEGAINSVLVSRLLFCAGHVAQCQLIHCELNIVKEIKKSKVDCATTVQGELEDELGIGGGDDQEPDFVRNVMEKEVGGAGGMLTAFEPLLVCVISNPNKFPCAKLQTAASLALSKFMLISTTLCEKYLQLFFTVLEKSSYPSLRANLIIAASDLVCRFPNVIEPWTPFLYSRLKDECSLVRKNTIMVLTHLILNDMIKIRGQISIMAVCLEDTNANIVELAKVFFYELSKKGNSLYNVLPDIISQLTEPQSSKCAQSSYRSIIKHLFQLIKKEKHHESLVEKLCHRLRTAQTDQQAHDLSYCFSLFIPTEKGLLKMNERFACYQDKLCDVTVHKHISLYANKAKKMKPEVKALAEELERKMNETLKTTTTCGSPNSAPSTPITSQ